MLLQAFQNLAARLPEFGIGKFSHRCDEWCFYGWKEGAAHQFLGPNNVPDVWSIKKLHSSKMVHLTEKPVEMAVRAMQFSSRAGENVLDLFGGSGSTLIAAEQTGRKAFLMELDQAYCDVYSRWVTAERQVQRLGTIVKSPEKNFPMKSPYLTVADQALEAMRKLMVEFGLTPSSRSRIRVPDASWVADEFDAFLAFIAGAGAEDDWTDAEVWSKANPSFGVTLSVQQFAEDCREAQESPARENSFRRYRLNQWTE